MATPTTKSKKNYRFILKERNALLWLVLLIFFVVLVVFLDSLKPNRIKVSYLEEEKNGKTTGTDIKTISELNKPAPPSTWKSFGDNFSSAVYLDFDRTNMYLDDVTTSLVFPPLHSWQKKEDCLNSDCGVTLSTKGKISQGLKQDVRQDIQQDVRQDIQQDARQDMRQGLEQDIRQGNFLFEKKEIDYRADLRKLPKPWPASVRNKNIISANLYNLDGKQDNSKGKQVVSFVVTEGKEERGFVYFLVDGQYEALISDKTEAEILTKYGRGDGYIAIGGEENNFLIFYIGYEIHAYHFFNNELIDISDFFGLRVADNGFYPYIIKQGEGTESVWYILSLEKDRPRLVKLWQNGTNNIKGSLDLSFQLNRYLENSGGEPIYIRSGLNKGELEFILESAEGNYSLWTFFDEGFDNSKTRQAVSINLNKKKLAIIKAEIRSLEISIDDSDGDANINPFFNDNFKIYLGDSFNNFLPVNSGITVKFNGEKKEFYWKAEFKNSNKNDYSPWFNHINDLQYLVYL